MRWKHLRTLVSLTLLTGVGSLNAHPPQQAPQTRVREIPGTPDRIIPGTPGVRITETRELIPPPPAEFLPRAKPAKVYREPPTAYYEAPAYYAPEIRYVPVAAAPVYVAAPTYVMVPKRVRRTPVRNFLFGP